MGDYRAPVGRVVAVLRSGDGSGVKPRRDGPGLLGDPPLGPVVLDGVVAALDLDLSLAVDGLRQVRVEC